MSAATTRSRTPDRLCAEAVDLARAAAEEAAAPGVVGEHAGLVSEGDRVVTHFFECKELGYRGWRWAVTVARASRAKIVTLDETVLLPGPDALLAPEWVPWSERLRPGDMGPGDLLPTEAEDLRLEPGYTGEDEPPPNSAVSEDMAELVEAEDAEVTAGAPANLPSRRRRGSIAAVAEELGMRRARVLSRYGLHVAADRWEEAFGAKTPMAQAAPASCVSCGFLIPIGGLARTGVRGVRERVLPGGRACGLPGVRVRGALGGGGHAEAAAAGPAGHRRDPGGPVPAAAVAGLGFGPGDDGRVVGGAGQRNATRGRHAMEACRRSRGPLAHSSVEDVLGRRGGDGAGEPAAQGVGVVAAGDPRPDVVGDVEAALFQDDQQGLGAAPGAAFVPDLFGDVGLVEGEVHGHQGPPEIAGRAVAQALCSEFDDRVGDVLGNVPQCARQGFQYGTELGSPACVMADRVASARSARASAGSVITGMLWGPATTGAG